MFGNQSAQELVNIGNYIQTGELQELAETGDKNASARMTEYTTNAAMAWSKATGRKDANGYIDNPPLRTYGAKKNLRPIVQVYANNKKEVYELWMENGNLMWYKGIPAATKDTDWTPVK